jgi:hypothetical protein
MLPLTNGNSGSRAYRHFSTIRQSREYAREYAAKAPAARLLLTSRALGGKKKFSHGVCPDCLRKLYPDYYPQI